MLANIDVDEIYSDDLHSIHLLTYDMKIALISSFGQIKDESIIMKIRNIIDYAWRNSFMSFQDSCNLLNEKLESVAKCRHKSIYLLCNLASD